MAKRDWLFIECEAGHDWRSLGGRNAYCHDEFCSCSVPVNFCRRCGDCDYGDNTDAEQVRVDCAALWGDPETRWLDPTPAHRNQGEAAAARAGAVLRAVAKGLNEEGELDMTISPAVDLATKIAAGVN